MRTIAQQWTSFEAAVVPAKAGRVQRMEMRRMFYAGFQAALMSLMEAAGESDDEVQQVDNLQRLHDECRAFARAVEAGKA